MVDALHQAPDSGDRRAALVHFVERVGAEDAEALRRALDALEKQERLNRGAAESWKQPNRWRLSHSLGKTVRRVRAGFHPPGDPARRSGACCCPGPPGRAAPRAPPSRCGSRSQPPRCCPPSAPDWRSQPASSSPDWTAARPLTCQQTTSLQIGARLAAVARVGHRLLLTLLIGARLVVTVLRSGWSTFAGGGPGTG